VTLWTVLSAEDRGQLPAESFSFDASYGTMRPAMTLRTIRPSNTMHLSEPAWRSKRRGAACTSPFGRRHSEPRPRHRMPSMPRPQRFDGPPRPSRMRNPQHYAAHYTVARRGMDDVAPIYERTAQLHAGRESSVGPSGRCHGTAAHLGSRRAVARTCTRNPAVTDRGSAMSSSDHV